MLSPIWSIAIPAFGWKPRKAQSTFFSRLYSAAILGTTSAAIPAPWPVYCIEIARTRIPATPPMRPTRSVRETVTIGIPASGLRLLSPPKATITVDIRPAPIERSIPGIVVHLLNVAAGRVGEVTPRQVTAHVRGPKEIVEGLTPQAFVGSVDLAGLRPGRYNLQVRLDPLQRLEVVGVEPTTVVARIR